MLRRSFREHPRLWLMLLAPGFLAVETACNGTPASSSGQVQISKEDARKFVHDGDKTVKAFRGGVEIPLSKVLKGLRAQVASDSSVYGNYKGSVNMTPPPGIHGLAGFTKGTFRAGAKAAYISTNSDRSRGVATVLVNFSAHGAGSLCLHMSWTTNETQQEITGKFEFLGGTGRAARLHDKGKLLGVQPTAFVAKGEVALIGTPSLGASRSIPKGCGSIKKPPPPKSSKVTLTFEGFAASVGAPRAGTTLHRDQSTVTDSTLCSQGGGLYAVFGYAGPSSGVYLNIGIFSPTQNINRNVDMKPGSNSVLMASRPKNGGYSFKSELLAKSGMPLTGSVFATGGAQVAANC